MGRPLVRSSPRSSPRVNSPAGMSAISIPVLVRIVFRTTAAVGTEPGDVPVAASRWRSRRPAGGSSSRSAARFAWMKVS